MWRRLLTKLKPKYETVADFESKGTEIKAILADINKPIEVKFTPKPKGRVIKQTRHSEFNPNPQRFGSGRVVKVMPRKLQQIKEAQEKFENDDQPEVTQLED